MSTVTTLNPGGMPPSRPEPRRRPEQVCRIEVRRMSVVPRAMCEFEGLAHTIRDTELDAEVLWIRGVAIRAGDLIDVVLCAVDEEKFETKDLEAVLTAGHSLSE